MVWVDSRIKLELIVSARVNLVRSLHLPDFPSGSSINFHDDKFYVIGDDSANVLVLDGDYRQLHAIHLFDHKEKFIPKVEKVDLEGSTVINSEGTNWLLIVGSASRKNRKRIIKLSLENSGERSSQAQYSIFKTKNFINRIKGQGIENINIEGVTLVGSRLLLANRGNRTHPQNHIFITSGNFWEQQDTAELEVMALHVPGLRGETLGLSEISYFQKHDILFLTLTSENTANAYDDGEIGDSYLGVIKNASTQLENREFKIDELLNLTEADSRFNGQKIEGICVEASVGDAIAIHLVADNDCGESTLFKIRLEITQ